MTGVPLYAVAYTLCYPTFFFVVGSVAEWCNRFDWVDPRSGHNDAARGLKLGAWAWYGIVLLVLLPLSFVRGRRKNLEGTEYAVVDTQSAPDASRNKGSEGGCD